MWLPFVHEDHNYLFKTSGGENVKIAVTDLKCLWREEVERIDFIARFKKSNPLFHGNEETCYEQSIKILQDPTNITNLEELDTLNIKLKTKLSDLPISLECTLQKAGLDDFYNEVTVPLIKTVQFLELSKNKMAELLVKKDEEIQEYSLELGKKIDREYKITEKYVPYTETRRSDMVLDVFVKPDAFNEVLKKKHGDILNEFPELKETVVKKRKLVLPNATKRRRI